MRIPVSVFIIACNEAERIGATLRSVGDLCDEIVVVDGGSTDGTQEIAAAFGARVVFHPWCGYGRQKQVGESLCRHAWLLNIDADEVLSEPLRNELRELFAADEPSARAYALRIVEVMPGETAPRAFAPFHTYVRLYHTSAGGFSASPAHDVVVLKEGVRVQRLSARIDHHTYRDVATQIDKFNRYSDLLVQQLQQEGRTIPAWRLLTEMPSAFVKAYVFRRHFARGLHGFITATSYAIFRFLRVAKLYELRKRGEEGSANRRTQSMGQMVAVTTECHSGRPTTSP